MAAKMRQLDITDESRSPFKTILLLAWPVLIEQIFSTLVSFADTAMVGSLGKEATASISISNSPVFLLNGIIMALGTGITTLIAQAKGAGDEERVRKLMRHAMLAILYIGVPIWFIVLALSKAIPLWMGAGPDILDQAAMYNLIVSCGRIFIIIGMTLNSAFRGYGDTKTPMKLNLIMNITNVVGNFLLIYPTRKISFLGVEFTMIGAGWGVNGAAAATALGMTIMGVMALRMAFAKDNPYRVSFAEKGSFLPDWGLTKVIFKISVPAMLERICMSSSGIFVTSSVATLGTAAIAANSLALSAESLSYMPAFAFQIAITTLVGQALGAGKPDLAKRFLRTTMWMAMVMMTIMGVVLYVFAAPIISVFTPDQEVIFIAAQCLMVMAFIQPPQAAAWIFSGLLRGAGDTTMNFIITLVTNWGIRTLFSVLCIRVFHLDLLSTYYVMCAEIVVRLVLLYIRYKSGKWIGIAKKVNG